MKDALPAVLLGGMAITQCLVAQARPQTTGQQSELKSVSVAADLPTLPPPPHGKSTILGGEIRNVDPVRDEITLKVFGQRPLKILFDERTQAFRDGNRIPLRELDHSDHASVETLLDGTAVYALTIHLLSQAPEGEDQGPVLNYNPETREVTVQSSLMRVPVKLMVPANILITRVGQPAFTLTQHGSADLTKGSLISVKFQPDKQGRSVAQQITVLATPGSDFVFNGNLSELDMHSGTLALVDTRDDATYQITFDSAHLPSTKDLHPGDRVVVTAAFDGNRYAATSINVIR